MTCSPQSMWSQTTDTVVSFSSASRRLSSLIVTRLAFRLSIDVIWPQVDGVDILVSRRQLDYKLEAKESATTTKRQQVYTPSCSLAEAVVRDAATRSRESFDGDWPHFIPSLDRDRRLGRLATQCQEHWQR